MGRRPPIPPGGLVARASGNHFGEMPRSHGDDLGNVFESWEHDRITAFLNAFEARQDRIVVPVVFVGRDIHDARQGEQVALDGGVGRALLASCLRDLGNQRPAVES